MKIPIPTTRIAITRRISVDMKPDSLASHHQDIPSRTSAKSNTLPASWMSHPFTRVAVGLGFTLGLVLLCSCGSPDRTFDSEEEALAHYEAFSRDYAALFIDNELEKAYRQTSRELRKEMDETTFIQLHEKAFQDFGVPTEITGFGHETVRPQVLMEEILLFPASVAPGNRRAVTAIHFRTTKGNLVMWLYIARDPGGDAIVAFEFR